MPSKAVTAESSGSPELYDVVIIGAGPAGLTAAIYARRANKTVLVLESQVCGGQMASTLEIENYPATPHISGPELSKKLYDQVMELGADLEFEEAVEIRDAGSYKAVVTEDDTYRARAVIIASGSKDRKLGLPLEDELLGRGVSYCANCDGAFFKDKIVAVNGGGNSALYSALYLSGVAQKVYIIHRRDTFRGDPILVDRLKQKTNVEYLMNTRVTALREKNAHLSAVELSSTDGSAPRDLVLDGFFVAIGRVPDTKPFANLITLDDSGYIKSDELCHTNVPGIFVAGDVRAKHLRQIVTATADGAIAATEAVNYLGE